MRQLSLNLLKPYHVEYRFYTMVNEVELAGWRYYLVDLPEEFHGQRSLVGYSTRGHKESNKTE